MKKIVSMLVLIILSMNLISCSRNTVDKVDNEKNDNQIENAVKKTSNTSDLIKAYINEKLIEDNEKILFYSDEDIDLDGNNEVIVAIGTEGEDKLSTYIGKAYVLKEIDGEIKQIGDNFAESIYAVYEVKLISLAGDEKKYIYCGLTNGANLIGFSIFELGDKEFKEIAYSASPTGAGSDEIIDSDNDGKIDGYVQNRWSYDVLYYPVKNIYEYNNQKFELVKTEVELPEYPNTPEEIVREYIALNVLEFQKSEEVSERLGKLCSQDVRGGIDFSNEELFEALAFEKLEFESDQEIAAKENGAKANVIVSVEGNKRYKFTLNKENDIWSIENIVRIS
ncbi:hypothetical protein ABCY62_19040 [Acetivibrio clariflavus]|uniref:hypothetical protein n=1 Tax=Acetivibrio clariflavus TaxID=288965 RepID=UPI0031F57667